MNPVVHFEMPAKDRKRIAKFYSNAFGWKTKLLGHEMGDYVLATTTKSAKDGHPKKPGRINGGFFPAKSNKPKQHPSVVISVDDIKKAMQKVKKAGGKVLGKPLEIPGYGLYVSFVDTEGNRASMMQGEMN